MKFYYTCPANESPAYYEIEAIDKKTAAALIQRKINSEEYIKKAKTFNNNVNLFLYDEREWNDCVKKYYGTLPYEKISQEFKPRLFVDMDGTLAEWRNIKIEITEYEDISEVPEKINDILYLPGYFKSLSPNKNIVNCVKQLIKQNELEVFILSCVLPDSDVAFPQKDKNEWLNKYLPEVDKEHRIFVPNGMNKRLYVPNGVVKTDYLLDDYTKNLKEWSIYGSGIKCLNGCNSKKMSWLGPKISIEVPAEILAKRITEYIKEGVYLEDNLPKQNESILSKSDIEEIINTYEDEREV